MSVSTICLKEIGASNLWCRYNLSCNWCNNPSLPTQGEYQEHFFPLHHASHSTLLPTPPWPHSLRWPLVATGWPPTMGGHGWPQGGHSVTTLQSLYKQHHASLWVPTLQLGALRATPLDPAQQHFGLYFCHQSGLSATNLDLVNFQHQFTQTLFQLDFVNFTSFISTLRIQWGFEERQLVLCKHLTIKTNMFISF